MINNRFITCVLWSATTAKKTNEEMYAKDRRKGGDGISIILSDVILSDVNLHLSYSEFQN